MGRANNNSDNIYKTTHGPFTATTRPMPTRSMCLAGSLIAFFCTSSLIIYSCPVFKEDHQLATAQRVTRGRLGHGTSVKNMSFINCSVCEPVIVITVHRRTLYLKGMFRVMKEAVELGSLSPDVLLIIAHDGRNQSVMDAVSQIDFMRVKQIFHPHSCADHPHEFPADDPSLPHVGKYQGFGDVLRSPWASCLKHAWWWMMNTVWDQIPELQSVQEMLFLEDDMLLSTDFHEVARRSIAAKPGLCDHIQGGCFGVRLQGKDAAMHSPISISRVTWRRFHACSYEFCHFDDYNWDLSLAHLWSIGALPVHVVSPTVGRVRHAGKCDGWDNPGRNSANHVLNCRSELRRSTEAFEKELKHKCAHSDECNTVELSTVPFTAGHHGWGGWRHPKDIAHCMAVAKTNSSRCRAIAPSFQIGDESA